MAHECSPGIRLAGGAVACSGGRAGRRALEVRRKPGLARREQIRGVSPGRELGALGTLAAPVREKHSEN